MKSVAITFAAFVVLSTQVFAAQVSRFELTFDVTQAQTTCIGPLVENDDGTITQPTCKKTYDHLEPDQIYQGSLILTNIDASNPFDFTTSGFWTAALAKTGQGGDRVLQMSCRIAGQMCHSSDFGEFGWVNYDQPTQSGRIFVGGQNTNESFSWTGSDGMMSLMDDQQEVSQSFSATLSNVQRRIVLNTGPLNAVPLNASMGFLGLGVFAFALTRWRKKVHSGV
ncbi:MAG: hypothetical protein AB8B71_10500 [Paracoccaceae bacterium]